MIPCAYLIEIAAILRAHLEALLPTTKCEEPEKQNKPLFFHNSYPREVLGRKHGQSIEYQAIDPLLGWSHASQKIPGYWVSNDLKKLSEFPRIMILGGSTSDPFDSGRWVRMLHDELNQYYPQLAIYGGGVGGYTSSQELLKLVRDINVIEPDIVIVYDGVNESVWFDYHSKKTVESAPHPFITDYILKALSPAPRFFPNVITLSRKLLGEVRFNLGPKNEKEFVKVWLDNHEKMHAITKSQGAQYLGILQPYLGSKAYQPNDKEKTFRFPDKERLLQFYERAKPRTQKYSFLKDGSDFFAGESGLFFDYCHLAREGNRKLAKKMASYIKPLLE